MKNSAKLVLFVLLFVFSAIELSVARKAVRIPGLIKPADRVVKVIELPDTEDFEIDGAYVDLGYLNNDTPCGEWVGYVGSTTRFIEYSEVALRKLLQKANISELPPPPGCIDVKNAAP